MRNSNNKNNINNKKENLALAPYLDFANHKAQSTADQVREVCRQVIKYGFNAAFVNPCWVKLAREELAEKGKVGTVVAFPLGQDTTEAKISAVLGVIEQGADEVDVSANVGWLKEGREEDYLDELIQVVRAAKRLKPAVVIKFIIEAYFLDPAEIKQAAHLVMQSGADFVKTTSGFGPRDAKIEYVKLIKSVVGDRVKIKAAGGIGTAAEVRAYLAAGADRIGTSKAVAIVTSSA